MSVLRFPRPRIADGTRGPGGHGSHQRDSADAGRRGGRGKWGKADYLRNSMQYLFTECRYLTEDFSIG